MAKLSRNSPPLKDLQLSGPSACTLSEQGARRRLERDSLQPRMFSMSSTVITRSDGLGVRKREVEKHVPASDL